MIIEALKAILEADAGVFALVGDRVYPVTLPDAPQYPAIVLTKISGPALLDMAGDANLERGRVQATIHTDQGVSHAITIRTAVKRLLHGYAGGPDSAHPCQIQGARCINDFDLTEPATERAGPKVRKRILEFEIWSQEL